MISRWGVGPSILMYHSIADNLEDAFTVSVGAFGDQISWLIKNDFEIIPLSSFVQAIQAVQYKRLSKKVVITFDDGYKDFITNALPILLDQKAPATVFIVTDLLGGRASWNDSGTQLQLMSEDEVRYIKAQGISLGSHTATHRNLKLLDQKEIQQQLKDSYDKLTLLGESFYAFSYPWDQWSSQVVDAVKASGYQCAVRAGGKIRPNAVNTYLLPRITVTRNMDLELFQSLLMRTGLEMEIRSKCRAMLNRICSLDKKSM